MSDGQASGSPTSSTPGSAEPTRTRVGKAWLRKMIAFLLLLIGFGCWGLYDATYLYPQRGIRHASYAQYDYLKLAKDKDRLGSLRPIDDPKAERKRLDDAKKAGTIDSLDQAKLVWLDALSNVGKLNTKETQIPDARVRLDELAKEWTSTDGKARAQPKPLAAYDIPVQWLFTAIGLGGGLWLLFHILNITRKSYNWDPATQRLGLPSGASIVPADIEDFDKRKWDKFLIFLKIAPSHPQLGGREVKLDLYHHDPLEQWVLEMERTRFPERAAEEARAKAAAAAAEQASGS